jgi:hypothetical protein
MPAEAFTGQPMYPFEVTVGQASNRRATVRRKPGTNCRLFQGDDLRHHGDFQRARGRWGVRSAAVRRGIGTALIATAVGIATALPGLLGNNVLNRRAQVMTEDFKTLLALTR